MVAYNLKVTKTTVQEQTVAVEANNPGSAAAFAGTLQTNPSMIDDMIAAKGYPKGTITYIVVVV